MKKDCCFGLITLLLCGMVSVPGVNGLYGADEVSDEDQVEINTTSNRNSRMYTKDVKKAVKRGLNFLACKQYQDGSWGEQYKVACTSLSGLSMLANGSTTNRGKYARNLKKAVEYLLAVQNDNGFFNDTRSRMHGHGFATMFMAEVYGMSNSGSLREPDDFTKRIKASLDKAIDILCTSQAIEGGFPYTPTRTRGNSHEGSITVCCVEGMRAARDAGIRVPRDNITEAVNYMKKTYGNGTFAYRLGMAPRSSYALSAAGACVLIATGDQSGVVQDMIDECIEFMKAFKPGAGNMAYGYYYYSHFYAAQAFHFRGGAEWVDWYKGAKRELMTNQIIDDTDTLGYWGSVGSEAGGDITFSTSISLLILQMPNEYLPIFQR
ncbi:prenyltransferase/squalene oxidase repeat-containing protein [Planctomycetota bacterium]